MAGIPIKLDPYASAPRYASPGAAGADLCAHVPDGMHLTIRPGERLLVPTGVFIELPNGYEAQIRPRSGLALKHGVTVLNAPGTIDSDYRGEIQVLLINHGNVPFKIMHGDRIAQMVVSLVVRPKFDVQDFLSVSKRGSGGFGSTGTK